jgi:hypothetical protein
LLSQYSLKASDKSLLCVHGDARSHPLTVAKLARFQIYSLLGIKVEEEKAHRVENTASDDLAL